MTGRLREELSRIGDTAPVADVPSDTWARARRARARDRALAGAVAVAVLALVAGFAGIFPSRESTPVAGGATPGVPSHLYGVPERLLMTDGNGHPSSDLVVTDPAVGVAAAAWATEYGGVLVVVGADDGGYHLLRPPGYIDDLAAMMATQSGSSPVALSPDGTHLAYAWSGTPTASGSSPVPSGVRVADLESGRIRTIVLHGGQGVLATDLAWSADGRWLAWSGQVLTQWTSGTTRSDDEVAGRIAPGSATSEAVPLPSDSNRALEIGDDGTVWIATTNGLTRWDGESSVVRAHPGRLARTGQIAPTGLVMAVGVGMDGPVANPGQSTLATLVDTATGNLTRLATDGPTRGQSTTPLGWVGDRLLVAVSPFDRDGGPGNITQRLELIGPGRAPTTVGTADYGVPANLTVATDLMTVARPTVDRPAPDWPWSSERLVLTIGLGVVAALALVGGVWVLWRRRSALM